jgi:hypothetical protein
MIADVDLSNEVLRLYLIDSKTNPNAAKEYTLALANGAAGLVDYLGSHNGAFDPGYDPAETERMLASGSLARKESNA